MAWHFHVVELADGRWLCRWGLEHYDTHHVLADAVEHLTAIAASNRPAEIFLHRLAAPVQSVAALE
jgi:hypothetical protein